MSDNERNRHKTGLAGLFQRGIIRDTIVFNEEDYDPPEIQPMTKKGYFDDDRRDIPTVRSSISEIEGNLRIFIGKGDRVVVKIDKAMPDVEMAAKNIFPEAHSTAMVINSGIGAVGLVLAAVNRGTRFSCMIQISKMLHYPEGIWRLTSNILKMPQ